MQNQPSPLLEISNLAVSYSTKYGALRAVDNVSLVVNRGEILGIVGESGCGKSTLALTILKMLPKSAEVKGGTVKFDETDVLSLTGESLRRYRWEKVAMVFQSAMNALDPVMSIEAQIVETITQHEQVTKDEARRRVGKLLQLVSIDPSRARAYPHELSGGMRQRVIISLALCLEAPLLIADEPTTALDVIVQAGVLRTLRMLQKELGIAVILITHDVSIMWEISDRLAVMYAGKIVELNETKKVIENPQHPYTEALLHAVPTIGSVKELHGIPSSPPSLINPPKGCRFHPRCPYAFDKCMTEPPLIQQGTGYVACWKRT